MLNKHNSCMLTKRNRLRKIQQLLGMSASECWDYFSEVKKKKKQN